MEEEIVLTDEDIAPCIHCGCIAEHDNDCPESYPNGDPHLEE